MSGRDFGGEDDYQRQQRMMAASGEMLGGAGRQSFPSSSQAPPQNYRGYPRPPNDFRSGSIGGGNWRSNSLSFSGMPQQQHPGQQPAASGGLPSYELAFLQAQQAQREMERMQRMSLGLGGSGSRRRSSMSDASASMGMSFSMYANNSDAGQATERLKKKRRMSSPTVNLSDQGGNSFPMPPLEGQERYVGGMIQVLESLETFRKIWDEQEERAKLLFPDDVEKQKEYAKCRLRSSMTVRRIL